MFLLNGLKPRPDWQAINRSKGMIYDYTGNLDTRTEDDQDDGVERYMLETTCAVFTEGETDVIGTAVAKLIEMFDVAGQYIIDDWNSYIIAGQPADTITLFDKMGIPRWFIPAIIRSWKDRALKRIAPTVYGRFDLGAVTDPVTGEIINVKLFENNAQTPTGIPESTSVQWEWFQGHEFELQDRLKTVHLTQWNELYEKLVERWVSQILLYEQRSGRKISIVHFAFAYGDESGEDAQNVATMMDAFKEAEEILRTQHGHKPIQYMLMRLDRLTFADTEEVADATTRINGDQPVPPELFGTEIGHFHDRKWRDKLHQMIENGELKKWPEGSDPDEPERKVEMIFSLYPWEMLVEDAGGRAITLDMLSDSGTIWVEPPYKGFFSNKLILAVLWHIFKNKPEAKYLLEAYLEEDAPAGFADNAVRKPMVGREGNGATVRINGEIVAQAENDTLGHAGYILQRTHLLPCLSRPWMDEKPLYVVIGGWYGYASCVGIGLRGAEGPITANDSSFVPHVLIERY